jgi:phospholipid N-methyltransferase
MEKTIRQTRQLVITQMLKDINIHDGALVLEPSAGSGDLADGILLQFPNIKIDCVELNKELRTALSNKGYNVIGNDFLTLTPTPIYDYIIGCPTYKDNVDIEHIMHMYKFLKPGGVILSLTYPAWTLQNSERQINFRLWLEDKMYTMKMLHDNSFVEDYKTQPSMLITIHKP